MTVAPAILIVEDEAVIALDLRLELEDMGYRVLGPARSGEQALALARQERPDLVLMDIRIQGALDGVDTAARMAGGGEPPVPVIFLTSHNDDETVARAARTAPYGFLTKPFQSRELRAAIEVALARAGMERARRELDAERARVQAAQARHEAQAQLLSRASHEMRTPLNAVLGFSQLLRTTPAGEDPTAQRYVGFIEDAGRQLLALVEDLLDLQQAQAQQLALRLEPVALDAAVRSALAPLAARAQARRIHLHADVAPQLRVRADASRLHKVLSNLADNAIKFGCEGGAVWVQAQPRGGRVRITVADNGPGIEPGHLAQLFEPFARGGREHTGIEGVGLGLATARSLAQAMGGTLTLQSVPQQGTVAALELDAG
ncbi:hybrid sensor histidine kinase/response regulator [Azohydromonas aeria]|uniref:hybrid sensor histidine kinase/response regulator n=1 Tax=Azohydromonas aeria TaxID=2590212 RepID=UPI0018DFEF11|nr:ATP-binding protein [Azohydromonas aeria]